MPEEHAGRQSCRVGYRYRSGWRAFEPANLVSTALHRGDPKEETEWVDAGYFPLWSAISWCGFAPRRKAADLLLRSLRAPQVPQRLRLRRADKWLRKYVPRVTPRLSGWYRSINKRRNSGRILSTS